MDAQYLLEATHQAAHCTCDHCHKINCEVHSVCASQPIPPWPCHPAVISNSAPAIAFNPTVPPLIALHQNRLSLSPSLSHSDFLSLSHSDSLSLSSFLSTSLSHSDFLSLSLSLSIYLSLSHSDFLSLSLSIYLSISQSLNVFVAVPGSKKRLLLFYYVDSDSMLTCAPRGLHNAIRLMMRQGERTPGTKHTDSTLPDFWRKWLPSRTHMPL